MPIWLRRIIFIIFVAAFFTIAPLLVLYTAGYRYSFSNGAISRTGVLSITTDPRNATISLNSEKTKLETPEVVKQIMPGEYTLALEKEGHHTWYGDIEIESGRTTQLQNVILFLDNDSTLLFNKQATQLAVSPQGNMIAYTVTEGGWQETWIYLLEQNSHTLLNQVIDNGDEMQIAWSAQGSYLFALNQDIELFQVFDKSGLELDLTAEVFAETGALSVIGASWHPSDDELISLTTENKILLVNMDPLSAEIMDKAHEDSFTLDASTLNLIQVGEYTEVAQYINDEKETLALLPSATYSIQERDGTYLILTDSFKQLYLIQIHADEPILLKQEVSSYDWDHEHDRLVYTNGFELSTYDANTHSTTLITRQSDYIKSVNWHPEAEIIFAEDSALRTFEVNPLAEQRFVTTLLENADIQSLWINQSGESAYYYGQKDGAYGVYQLLLSEGGF